MGLDTWSGAEFWDNADAADIPTATLKLVQSIRSELAVRFPTTAARAAATAAALTLIGDPTQPYAQAPMFAVVDDLGACFYDGNTDSGTGGWRWLGGARELIEVGPLAPIATSGGEIAIGSGSGWAYDTDSGAQYRLVRYTVNAELRSGSAAPLTALSQVRIKVEDNGLILDQMHVKAIIHPGGSASTTAIPVAATEGRSTSWTYRMRGAHTVRLLLDMPISVSGQGVAESTYLQVHDLGPAY